MPDLVFLDADMNEIKRISGAADRTIVVPDGAHAVRYDAGGIGTTPLGTKMSSDQEFL